MEGRGQVEVQAEGRAGQAWGWRNVDFAPSVMKDTNEPGRGPAPAAKEEQ